MGQPIMLQLIALQVYEYRRLGSYWDGLPKQRAEGAMLRNSPTLPIYSERVCVLRHQHNT
eukprot:scaffold121586_cov20-Prasinocladus_malaysianus.AAC.3